MAAGALSVMTTGISRTPKLCADNSALLSKPQVVLTCVVYFAYCYRVYYNYVHSAYYKG